MMFLSPRNHCEHVHITFTLNFVWLAPFCPSSRVMTKVNKNVGAFWHHPHLKLPSILWTPLKNNQSNESHLQQTIPTNRPMVSWKNSLLIMYLFLPRTLRSLTFFFSVSDSRHHYRWGVCPVSLQLVWFQVFWLWWIGSVSMSAGCHWTEMWPMFKRILQLPGGRVHT